MSEELTYRVHFRNGTKGKKRLKGGAKPPEPKGEAVPRIARLMALAIHFDQLIRDGVVEDYADLARLGKVSRARITQIMDLLNLSPDVQEALLCRDNSTSERRMRKLTSLLDWTEQRRLWQAEPRGFDIETESPMIGGSDGTRTEGTLASVFRGVPQNRAVRGSAP